MEHSLTSADIAECQVKPLDSLCHLADEAERASTLISSFINRFRIGVQPPQSGGPATLKPVPSGHAGQLERLTGAIAELNSLARELGSIG